MGNGIALLAWVIVRLARRRVKAARGKLPTGLDLGRGWAIDAAALRQSAQQAQCSRFGAPVVAEVSPEGEPER
jgi:hypothetical protein